MNPQLCARHLSRFSLLIQTNASNAPKFVFQISHFNTLSSSTGTTSYSTRSRYEEESRNVRVSVWWDFENCNLPGGTNAYRVAQFVAAAIRTNGIKGPIQITAFGDVTQLSRSNQEALSSTGINLAHVPNGGKNSADRSLLVDLMYWVTQNPPPAHLFLISSDRDFAGILHRLRMNNYNILLASRESSPSVLCSAASIVWDWNCLLNGENLSGKHYNRPPDGPFGSWYGHYKAPLEELFAVAERPVSPRSEGVPDTDSDVKVRPIPKIVVKHIRQVLSENPKGISITGLRSELSERGLYIDKEYYGYKKLSSLLSSLPAILTLTARPDGQFLVCGVDKKVSEQVESPPGITSGPVVVNGKTNSVPLSQANGELTTSMQNEEKPTLPCSEEPMMGITNQKMKNIQKQPKESTLVGITNQKMKNIQKQPEESTLLGPKLASPSVRLEEQATAMQKEGRKGKEQAADINTVDESKEFNTQLDKLEKSPPSELGFFKRIWMKWFGHEVEDSEENACTKNGLISPENMEAKEKEASLATEDVESVAQDSVSLSFRDSTTGHEIPKPSAVTSDKNIESSFFNQIIRKFSFWRGLVDSNDSSEEVQEKPIKIESHSDKSDIFEKESFWVELRAFFDTAEAAAIVIQSATRKQLVQNLCKKGPSILRSLTDAKLHHLLELLISDKKWIKESSLKRSPFKLIRGDDKRSLSNNSSRDLLQSSGLSSIFSKPQESSFPEKKQEFNGQTKHQNPLSESSSPSANDGKPFKRSEGLADCQKLIDELLKDHPEGFYMGSFRRIFHKKYGYELDTEKLGYSKLSFLLETFSGVRIESTFVVPSRRSSSSKQFLQETITKDITECNNSENKATNTSGKEDDSNSVWDELGPVASSGHQNDEKRPGLYLKTEGVTQKRVHHDYESLSDDYLTESDDDTVLSEKTETKKRTGFDEEESSLLQVLDSWHSSKTDNGSKKARNKEFSKHLDAVSDSSGSDSGESSSAELKVKFESHVNYGGRQRPSKSYSFVADQPMESRDKLIDGILGRLKKEDNSSQEI